MPNDQKRCESLSQTIVTENEGGVLRAERSACLTGIAYAVSVCEHQQLEWKQPANIQLFW